MPVYEYRCDSCREITTVFGAVSENPDHVTCESCGVVKAHRILSRPSVRLSNLSKLERLDPKYDKQIDQAIARNPAADPDRLINRRGDISKGRDND